MSYTTIEADALLEASVGNLALLVRDGHVSAILGGQIVVALVSADDRRDGKQLRYLAGEVERGRRMFAGIEAADGLTPEAATMGRMFAISTLRAILASPDA